MKFTRQDVPFSPIAIIIESEEELNAMWEIVCPQGNDVEAANALAIKISNYFSEAKP